MLPRVRQNNATKKRPWHAPSKEELAGIQPIFRTPIANNYGQWPHPGSHLVLRIRLPPFNAVAAAAAHLQFPCNGNTVPTMSSVDVPHHRMDQQHREAHNMQTRVGWPRPAGSQEEGPVMRCYLGLVWITLRK